MQSRSPEGAAPGADVSSDVAADARRYHTSVDLSNKNSSITQLILLTGRNKKVLEAGPATGYVTQVLRARGCQVTAIERDPKAAELAARFCERMLVGDIEEMDLAAEFAGDQFDVVMFGDVLEHLVNPSAVLKRVRPLLREGGYVVASVPNIAHASVRLMLLDGGFAYTDKGLLDHTHVRFFNRAGLEALFKEAGYRIRVWRRTVTDSLKDPFAEEISLRESELPPHLVAALQEDPEALTYQFVVRAYPHRVKRLNARKSRGISASASGSVFKALWHLEEVLAEQNRSIADMKATLAAKDDLLAEKDAALAQKDGQIADLEAALHNADTQVSATRRQIDLITNSVGYRLLERIRRLINRLAPPGTRRRVALRLYRRGLRIVLAEGWIAFLRRAVLVWRWGPRVIRRSRSASEVSSLDEQYQLWLQAHALTPAQIRRIRKETLEFAYRPKVSIVMPVYNSAPSWLREAIESVRAQLYDNWELCIADDASTEPAVRAILQEYQGDERIKVTYLDENRGISGASNAALAMATGEFVGFLDHDDELKQDALYEVVKLLNEQPDLDFIYSDEDKRSLEGRLVQPFFKPDWSPDLEYSSNYVTHFSVYRRETVERVGGCREGFEGSQDYDLVLRVTELTDKIGHIRKVLYTWRMVPGSAAASSEAKPYAYAAAKKALAESLERRGIDAWVEDGWTKGWYRIRYRVSGAPMISVIIPTRDRADLLRRCLNKIEEGSSKRVEVIVVDNGSVEEATHALLRSRKLKVVRDDGPFNFSRLINAGAAVAEGDFLLLLNNDVEAAHEGWIEAMLEHAQRAEVGVVGARLLYPGGKPQHEGVALSIGSTFAGHIDWRDYLGLSHAVRNCSAVTAACAMTRRAVFEELGGFDERFRVAYGDVDYCLRARSRGYLIVYTPYALLYHYESASRGENHPPEDEKLARQRWGHLIDPYYNYALEEVFKPWVSKPPAAVG